MRGRREWGPRNYSFQPCLLICAKPRAGGQSSLSSSINTAMISFFLSCPPSLLLTVRDFSIFLTFSRPRCRHPSAPLAIPQEKGGCALSANLPRLPTLVTSSRPPRYFSVRNTKQINRHPAQLSSLLPSLPCLLRAAACTESSSTRHDPRTDHEDFQHSCSHLPSRSMMKKPARKTPSTVQYKSTKRKRSAGAPAKYSKRDIDWEEQQELGGQFVEVGEGSWPVSKILKERITGRETEYYIEWRQHPRTGERFRPEWVRYTQLALRYILLTEGPETCRGHLG